MSLWGTFRAKWEIPISGRMSGGPARRKEAYEALHPETKAHVAGAHGSNKSQGNASANLAPAFTADTAAKTGQSERAVQRDAERGAKVCPQTDVTPQPNSYLT